VEVNYRVIRFFYGAIVIGALNPADNGNARRSGTVRKYVEWTNDKCLSHRSGIEKMPV
jgi:hypothetical protein